MADGLAVPRITLHYLAAFAGVFALLSLVVVALRVRYDTPFGDGGHPHLLHAIRAHANFSEWVPLTLLLLGGLEAVGEPAAHLHALFGVLLFARIAHPIGLFSPAGSRSYFAGRIAGALSTWGVLSAAALRLAVAV